MYLLYLDEFGHDGLWNPNDPAHAHHPNFGLAGIAVSGARVRELDRGYLALKLQYFKFEIERDWRAKNQRPERFEPKQLKNRRDLRFAADVLGLVKKLDAYVFVQGIAKPVGPVKDGNTDALYGSLAQRMLQGFERFLRNKAGHKLGCGMIVMDRRDEARDLKLLASAQSHLFSATGRLSYERIVETPLLVRSDWYHGVQAADTVARVAGCIYRYRETQDPKLQKFAGRLQPLLTEVAWTHDRFSSIHVRPYLRPTNTAGQHHTPARLPNPVLTALQAKQFSR